MRAARAGAGLRGGKTRREPVRAVSIAALIPHPSAKPCSASQALAVRLRARSNQESMISSPSSPASMSGRRRSTAG